MGVLIIKNVRYHGDKYQYQSPELHKGLNVIYGDNGSGKSTFSYFLEYGLGGRVSPFSKDHPTEKYRMILEDTNNFVELQLSIDNKDYILKRFLQHNEVFIQEGDEIIKLPTHRQGGPFIFSDWILQKLNIPKFEMNSGATTWFFGFPDLFRLLNYDQDTEDKKIYKAAPADNFIADSIVVRKAIFEILLGLSSAEYFKKQDELKDALKKRDQAKDLKDSFAERYQHLISDVNVLNANKKDKEDQLIKLTDTRDTHLKEKTNVSAKLTHLTDLQQKLLNTELSLSEEAVKLSNYNIENNKIDRLLKDSFDEISQLKKIIFTHDKLDLFKMEVCPFCATEKRNKEEGYCICGSKFNDDDYEKFVYSSGEYQDILKHKEKSIEAVEIARKSYTLKVNELTAAIKQKEAESISLKAELEVIISKAEFSGNTALIDSLNIEIIKVKDDLFNIDKMLEVTGELQKLEREFKSKNADYGIKLGTFKKLKEEFEANNANTITNFNTIYSDLLSKSSYSSTHAELNDDYLPLVDNGDYKKKSADVPRRLMYYYTLLSMALKYPTVKHPKFLLIDTPDNSGIDKIKLKNDISLFNRALALAKNDPDDSTEALPDFQVILTIGYGRLPDEFENYVVEKFNTETENFILKSTIDE